MGHADNPASLAGQSPAAAAGALPPRADLVILGAGIMGLWAAVKAERLGIETVLLDAAHAGAGASGGLLGALMSHTPDKWNEKKQFQFDALLSLENEVARLEAETGLSCGYRRSGRLIPLPKPHLHPIALRHREDARTHWRGTSQPFHWSVLESSPHRDWPDAAFAEAGLVHDTFAAKVAPRRLVGALAECLRSARHVRVVEGLAALRIDPAAGRIECSGGAGIAFGHCIVAAGPQSFPLLGGPYPALQRPLGQPVKGQAALLKADFDPGLPLLFLNGLYVVPHEGGHVAIGSTSEEEFAAPFATDEKLEELVERARALAPVLRSAQVVERWAGLRPKAVGRDPMVGADPEHPQVIALTGGFKVSFGIAHALADAALAAVLGQEMAVPSSFAFSHHLAAASR
jgi:glycine oxidase